MTARISRILGIDFTSAPTRRKPITIARCVLDGDALHVVAPIEEAPDFEKFEALLREPGPWIGGFDFPFGLPRRFVDAQVPGADWSAMVRAMAALGREGFSRITYTAFRAARGNLAAKHRVVDLEARSHSPLKTMDVDRRQCVNPPVGLMFFEGARRLEEANVCVPGLRDSADARVALEVYPGHLARSLGERLYKNDAPKHGTSRVEARTRILERLALAEGARPAVFLAQEERDAIRADPSGDRLDAVLCAVQAAIAARRTKLGIPPHVDPCEGWIAGL